MTDEEFVSEVAAIIENAILRTQGIGDYLGHEATPEELASEILALARNRNLTP